MLIKVADASSGATFYKGEPGWYFFGIKGDVYGPYEDRAEARHDYALYLNAFYDHLKAQQAKAQEVILTPDKEIVLQ